MKIQNNDLENTKELTGTHINLTLRLLRSYRACVNIVLPASTQRRMIYDRLIKMLRVAFPFKRPLLNPKQAAGPGNANKKSRSKNNNQRPVIVYNLGKVGSKTVELSVKEAYRSLSLDIPVHHVHFLNYLEERINSYSDRNPLPAALRKEQAALELRKQIDAQPDKHWNLISLVREPVGRNISSFFQHLKAFIPDWKQKYSTGTLDLAELQQIFLRLGAEHHHLPDYWFDTQMKPVFNIDVYSSPFPTTIGYKIYPDSVNASLLVIRAENLNSCGKPALQEFLGLNNLILINDNEAGQKDYADLYKAFKETPLPIDYVQEMYSMRYACHFYSPVELEQYFQKWTGKK